MRELFVTLLCLGVFAVAANAEIVVVDSQGFEGFNLGNMNNQAAGYWWSGLAGAKKWQQNGGSPVFQPRYEVVDLGGDHGKVVKFKPFASEWESYLSAEIGLQGGLYAGQWQYTTTSYDVFFDNGEQGTSDLCVRTYRNADVVEQASVWTGNNGGNPSVDLELRPTATAAFWPPYHMADTTFGAWHNVKFTTYYDPTKEDTGYVDVWFDGVQIAHNYRTWWAGWGGWLDDVKFLNNTTGTGVTYMDNFQVSYGSAVPEPATMGLLAAGVIGLIRRSRKA